MCDDVEEIFVFGGPPRAPPRLRLDIGSLPKLVPYQINSGTLGCRVYSFRATFYVWKLTEGAFTTILD